LRCGLFCGSFTAAHILRWAEADFKAHGAQAALHILIFDEIDAIFRTRGQGDGSAASMAFDGVVNALLTKMDGLTKTDNIIVFGLTNRRELIEPALLRPGRFEVEIEVSQALSGGLLKKNLFNLFLFVCRLGYRTLKVARPFLRSTHAPCSWVAGWQVMFPSNGWPR
jgi:hypothetical protein